MIKATTVTLISCLKKSYELLFSKICLLPGYSSLWPNCLQPIKMVFNKKTKMEKFGKSFGVWRYHVTGRISCGREIK